VAPFPASCLLETTRLFFPSKLAIVFPLDVMVAVAFPLFAAFAILKGWTPIRIQPHLDVKIL